jgi:hypothetical protein
MFEALPAGLYQGFTGAVTHEALPMGTGLERLGGGLAWLAWQLGAGLDKWLVEPSRITPYYTTIHVT